MTRPHALLLTFGLLACQAVWALPLENGDFVSFNGWSGVADNAAGGSVGPVDPSTRPDLFQLIGGGMARLQTSPDAVPADNFYRAELDQTFDIAPVATSLTFDYGWQVTDLFDVPYALLIQSGTGFLIDLFAEAGVDINRTSVSGESAVIDLTSAALAFDPRGSEVQILFGVEDASFDDVQDRFDVGNIAITSVPAPTPLVLLASALIGLGFVRRAR